MQKLVNSRWMWFVKGLPTPARAAALFRVRRHTMTTPVRCRTLWDQCQQVLRQGIPGCFVECGVWRGGSAGVMGLAIRHAGQSRDLHLFDSFEGLPEPTEKDGQQAKDYSGGRASGTLQSVNQCKAGLDQAQDLLLGQLALDQSKIHFHVGWFQQTVPEIAPKLGPIALLRLDGDWYESTRICLENLYPLLSPGGIVILDDYFAWAGCKQATDDYRTSHQIASEPVRIDLDAAYWVKS